MKKPTPISNRNIGFSDLVDEGVKKLKLFGFENVNEENILTDEVYVFFFTRFLDSQRGKSKELDKQVEMLLYLIQAKV